jgi:outer membrane protein, multidrug efflux system
MLNRRPDILAALKAIEAAGLRISGSKKELLPGVTLSANAGTVANQYDRTLNAQNLLWSLAGNLSQPIFEGGRIRSYIDLAEATEKTEIAQLVLLVYKACQEIETSRSAEKFLKEKEAQVKIAVEESTAAFEIASDRYSKGLADIITLLISQRSDFNSRSRLLDVQLQRLNNRLNLYLALGGDIYPEKPTLQEKP